MNRSAFDVGKTGSNSDQVNALFKAKTGRDLDDTSPAGCRASSSSPRRSTGPARPDAAKIQQALKATDLKPEQLMIGYGGVKFDETARTPSPRPISSSCRARVTNRSGRRAAPPPSSPGR